MSKPFRIGELVPKIEELAQRYCTSKREVLQQKALRSNDSGISFTVPATPRK